MAKLPKPKPSLFSKKAPAGAAAKSKVKAPVAKEKKAKEETAKEKSAKTAKKSKADEAKKKGKEKENPSDSPAEAGTLAHMTGWFREEGPWWACSFGFHLVLVCSLALISGKVVQKIDDEAPAFEEATLDKAIDVPKEIERFEVGETPEDPTELSTDTLALEKPGELAQEEKHYDDSATFTEASGGGASNATSNQPNLGGLGGFDIKGFGAGPAAKSKGGVGVGVGMGNQAGSGGQGMGFGSRGTGSRKAMLGSGGGTRQSERAVAAGLNWIARHQSPNGSWSFSAIHARCKARDESCYLKDKDKKKVAANIGDRSSAATAMALLPFFAAGQTHESRGKYKNSIYAGVAYLVKNQKKDGDLRGGGGSMYDHGLATIALCECYGMSGDKAVKQAAQAAIMFISASQDPKGGGWRYAPKEAGDTSAVGWQLMGLKSGQMAYLNTDPEVFARAKGFMKTVASGTPGALGFGGMFTYVPGGGPTPCLTAVGLLCCQYMGITRTDPAMVEGTALIMQNQPDPKGPNYYYWYYATQVMHNQPGPDWDTWNRKMRRTLIDTQCKEDCCAAGSWDPAADPWGATAGRLYSTSLATLTLEVYYRYLPLYKLDKGGEKGAADADAKAGEKKK
jgi:hypothetical protein